MAVAVGAEDLHLTSGQIDVPGLILGDAFAPGVGEELHVGDSARVSYVYLVRLLLSLVADVEGMTGKGFRDAEGVEDVGHLGAPGEGALNEVLRGGDEDAVVRRDVLPGARGGDALALPGVEGAHGNHAGARRCGLGREHGELVCRRVGMEAVDGSLPCVGGNEQVAGLVEGEIDGIERGVADGRGFACLRRPAIDALPVRIDEVESRPSLIDGAAGDVEEAVGEALDVRAGCEDGGGGVLRSAACWSPEIVERGELAGADFGVVVESYERIVEGDFAVAVQCDVADANVG